jgi:predicted ATPase
MSAFNTISRVVVENYKSISFCDISLDPVTFLVGPNGAGKSNFVEALRFLSYALNTSLEQAIESRGGFQTIVRHGGEHSGLIRLRVDFRLDQGVSGTYEFQLGFNVHDGLFVRQENCLVHSVLGDSWFKVDRGRVSTSEGLAPAASVDKLYLVNASGLSQFEPIYRALSGIMVYSPSPDQIRTPQPEKVYRYLDRTGGNLAETIDRLQSFNPEILERVTQYMSKIVPGLTRIEALKLQSHFAIRFELDHASQNGSAVNFFAQNMSDGTLRALAVLVALFQPADQSRLMLVGLEEPEAGLHPAAAGVLFDALVEASQQKQVLVTSHSPDLLDRKDIPISSLLAVSFEQGQTVIGPLDDAGRMALRDHLYTAGELLRMDQLRPSTTTRPVLSQ